MSTVAEQLVAATPSHKEQEDARLGWRSTSDAERVNGSDVWMRAGVRG
jgi:hypothetical protein